MYNDGSTAGVSSPTLIAVTFTGNFAAHGGGAMSDNGDDGNKQPEPDNGFLQRKQALFGGAMYSLGFGEASAVPGVSSPTFSRASYSLAIPRQAGGAMYNAALNGGQSIPKLSIVTFNDNRGAAVRAVGAVRYIT